MKYLSNEILYGFHKTFDKKYSWTNITALLESYCTYHGIYLDAVEPRWIKFLYKKINIYQYTVIDKDNSVASSTLFLSGVLIDILRAQGVKYTTVSYEKCENNKSVKAFTLAYSKFIKTQQFKELSKYVNINLSKIDNEFVNNERYIWPNTITLTYSLKIPNYIYEILNIFYEELLESLPEKHTLQYDSRLSITDGIIVDSWSIRIKDEYASFITNFKYDDIWNDIQETAVNESSINVDKLYKSFNINIDDNGDILISQKEYDSFDKHFTTTKRLLKNYYKNKNFTGMKNELCKLSYMIKLIEIYHMGNVSSDEERKKQKELLDLRSVMINSFSFYIEHVIENEPDFDFQSYFDNSKYGKTYKLNVLGVSRLARKVISVFI